MELSSEARKMQSQQTVKEEDDEGPPPGWQPLPAQPPPPPRPSGQLILFFSKPFIHYFLLLFFYLRHSHIYYLVCFHPFETFNIQGLFQGYLKYNPATHNTISQSLSLTLSLTSSYKNCNIAFKALSAGVIPYSKTIYFRNKLTWMTKLLA